MNSNNSNSVNTVSAAVGALEGWLETFHAPGGYTGPVVGVRGMALSWCGPAQDWRCEGLLDGWVARHRLTADPVYLDRIAQSFRDLQAAQLADGSFRNSSFEYNPLEGGMPHEPAVMAAVLRAGRYLREVGREWPAGTATFVERFVEERLIKALWNKTLQTFNNWLQSDFTVYAPPAVASIIETLDAYGDLTGTTARWTPYIVGAAESLLKSQFRVGPLAGAFPATQTDRASASPSLAARCLPVLLLLHRRTGDERFAEAGDRLADFVKRELQDEGGIACWVFANRPARVTPLFTGATAAALSALNCTDRLDDTLANQQIAWLLARQSALGGFETAVGFESGLPQRNPPDWRDVFPVCGWATQVYALLANRMTEPATCVKSGVECVRREVTVRGRRAEMTEDADTLTIQVGKDIVFLWRKRTPWPEVCFL